MKLKSFKKKGATGDRIEHHPIDPIAVDHHNYPIAQITVDSKERQIEIMWQNDNDDVRFLDTGDILALTIDDGRDIFLARQKVSMVGDRLVARIAEHKEAEIRSSKQLPSSRWKRFLTELKKKCDSGHHNKKRKTLLHVIKMAQAREAAPESIQLQVRLKLAQENDAKPGQELRAAVQKIEEALEEADTASQTLDLGELDELLPSDVVIADANHTPRQAKLDAITIMMNGVSVTTSNPLENKQSITISDRVLEKALCYNTQQNGRVELDEYNLHDLLDTKQQRVSIYLYSHDDGLTVHSNKSVKNITRSSNGDFEFELESDLAAGSGTLDFESALVQITSSKLEDGNAVDGSAIADGPCDDGGAAWECYGYGFEQILEIPEDNYELISLPDSNIRRVQLLIPVPDARLIPFIEGENYFLSVGDTDAVFTVDSLVVDDVTAEPVKQILVHLSYMGGRAFELLEAEQSPLIVKRLYEASQQRVEAIQLTLEKRTLEHLADLPYANPKELEEIADGIDGLIGEDQDGISVAEVATWVPELAVTGVKYNPRQLAYNTKSSVTSGLEIDVWMSADGAYSLLDLDPAELANVESVGHSSTQRVIDEEPQSEVKGEKFAQILDEVRGQVLAEVRRQALFGEVDPGYISQHRVSIYNGEKGIDLCNN